MSTQKQFYVHYLLHFYTWTIVVILDAQKPYKTFAYFLLNHCGNAVMWQKHLPACYKQHPTSYKLEKLCHTLGYIYM